MIYAAAYPLLVGFNSIPKVAIVPILVIWFGIGTIPAVITSLVISLFPVTANLRRDWPRRKPSSRTF